MTTNIPGDKELRKTMNSDEVQWFRHGDHPDVARFLSLDDYQEQLRTLVPDDLVDIWKISGTIYCSSGLITMTIYPGDWIVHKKNEQGLIEVWNVVRCDNHKGGEKSLSRAADRSICGQSGYWWNPALFEKLKYVLEGERFPSLPPKKVGETYWVRSPAWSR